MLVRVARTGCQLREIEVFHQARLLCSSPRRGYILRVLNEQYAARAHNTV